ITARIRTQLNENPRAPAKRIMKNLPCILFIVASCVNAAAAPAPRAVQADTRPNIVFILIDDFGYADCGPYGAKDIRTPHIDRLARDGVKFTDFYSNGPVC